MRTVILTLLSISCLAGIGAGYVGYFVGDPKIYTVFYGVFCLIGPLAFLLNWVAYKKGHGIRPSELWLVFGPLVLLFVDLEPEYRALILLVIALAILITILYPASRKI